MYHTPRVQQSKTCRKADSGGSLELENTGALPAGGGMQGISGKKGWFTLKRIFPSRRQVSGREARVCGTVH